jgi:hypothetical protein
MESEQWSKDRKIGEGLLRALAKVTPGALKTLQHKEAEVMAKCGQERSERPAKKKKR